jgi:hypothetical protein
MVGTSSSCTRKSCQPGNLVRKILDIYGRVSFRMHEAQIHRDDEVPFEVPILYKKGRELIPPFLYLPLSIFATSRLAWPRFCTVFSRGWNG